MKHLYVCRTCHSWYSGNEQWASGGCKACGGSLYEVPIDFEKWAEWPAEAKEAFKAEFLRTHDIGKPSPAVRRRHSEYQPAPQDEYEEAPATSQEGHGSAWISGLKLVSWCTFLAFILAGLLLGGMFGDVIGIVIFLVLSFLGFMSVGMTMVFLGMAQDLRVIRSMMRK